MAEPSCFSTSRYPEVSVQSRLPGRRRRPRTALTLAHPGVPPVLESPRAAATDRQARVSVKFLSRNYLVLQHQLFEPRDMDAGAPVQSRLLAREAATSLYAVYLFAIAVSVRSKLTRVRRRCLSHYLTDQRPASAKLRPVVQVFRFVAPLPCSFSGLNFSESRGRYRAQFLSARFQSTSEPPWVESVPAIAVPRDATTASPATEPASRSLASGRQHPELRLGRRTGRAVYHSDHALRRSVCSISSRKKKSREQFDTNAQSTTRGPQGTDGWIHDGEHGVRALGSFSFARKVNTAPSAAGFNTWMGHALGPRGVGYRVRYCTLPRLC